MKRVIFFLLLVASLASAHRVKAKPEPVVLDADRAFAADLAKRGLEGWMAAFADDAVLFAAKPPVVGKDAIRRSYEPNFADPEFSLSCEMLPPATPVTRSQPYGSWKVIADGGAPDAH